MESERSPSAPSPGSSTGAPAEEGRYLWGKRHSVLYRCELSYLYHRKRERFFALLDRSANIVALIAGSAALSELLPAAGQKAWAGAVVAAATIPQLMLGWAELARRHSSVAARFKSLEADIVGAGERDFTEEDVKSWDRRVRLIETEEPPALASLVELCQIELQAAVGTTPQPMQWWRRWLSHIFSMDGTVSRRVRR